MINKNQDVSAFTRSPLPLVEAAFARLDNDGIRCDRENRASPISFFL